MSRKIHRILLSLGLMAGLTPPTLAAQGPYLFDWGIRDDFVAGMEDYTPVPHPGHDWSANHSNYTTLYSQLDAQGRPITMMLQPDTNPLDGSADPNALSTVLGYVPRMNFVFADFEDANQDAQMQAVINQVRSHPNPAINSAYVANYADYPGAIDNSAVWPDQVDRTGRDTFYRTSGTNIANPNLYPYEYYDVHSRSDIWGSNVAPNKRAALFWAPLEKLSVAKRNLPAGHLLIPWTARFIDTADPGYSAPLPTREDVMAMIQHIRLRGADGYFRLGSIVSDDPNFVYDLAEDAQDRQDMLTAWHSLDGLFGGGDHPVTILNLETNKTLGLQWSGVQVGGQVAILISNLSNSQQRITLPDIEGLPTYSDYVPAGQHQLTIYSVPEPASMALLGMLGLSLLGRRRRV